MGVSWGGEVSRIIFLFSVTLTSDIISRIIVSRAYSLSFKVGIPNLVCGCILGGKVLRTIIESL